MNNYIILKEYDTGDNVIYLQELMRINDYYPATITGSFGLTTKSYLEKFQSDKNLEVTGTATIETWEMLESGTKNVKDFSNKNSVLQEGDEGEEVKEIQTKLKALLYYNGEITGIFDSATKEAVTSFQFVNKLLPDGIVGKNTWNALIYLYRPLPICGGETEPENELTYTVVAGDTLYKIANKFGVTVDTLKSLNNLTGDSLSIGQVLIIKESDVSPEIPEVPSNKTHTVIKGDTLYSISRKYNVSIDEIKSLNNLTSDTLSLGQTLIIEKIDDNLYPPIEPDEPLEPTYLEHTVSPGETLYSIANRYNTTVDKIIEINNLVSNTLSIGQILLIEGTPSEEPEDVLTHTVIKGETLYSIAKKYNMSVDELKRINNLTSNTLSIGQVLILEDEILEEGITYIVQKGDTLYSISRKFNVSVDDLINKNNLTNNTLSIGQVLKIS